MTCKRIGILLSTKIIAAFWRLYQVFWLLPVRLVRLLRHFVPGRSSLPSDEKAWSWAYRCCYWGSELVCLILACVGLGEVYETLQDFAKFNTRSLHAWEIDLARSVFGDSIDYKWVRIDEYAFLGPKQTGICYVSFRTINSWGSMHRATLLHELTHVWQYQYLGVLYIPKALSAQLTTMGYNYGGVAALRKNKAEGKSLAAFNLEQQGDIISDYYLIREGYQPRWGSGGPKDLPVYEYFIEQFSAGLVDKTN